MPRLKNAVNLVNPDPQQIAKVVVGIISKRAGKNYHPDAAPGQNVLNM